jgi:hypothetical protein
MLIPTQSKITLPIVSELIFLLKRYEQESAGLEATIIEKSQ